MDISLIVYTQFYGARECHHLLHHSVILNFLCSQQTEKGISTARRLTGKELASFLLNLQAHHIYSAASYYPTYAHTLRFISYLSSQWTKLFN